MSIFSIIYTEIVEFTRASFGSTVYDPSRTQPRELLVLCVVFVFHSYSVCEPAPGRLCVHGHGYGHGYGQGHGRSRGHERP